MSDPAKFHDDQRPNRSVLYSQQFSDTSLSRTSTDYTYIERGSVEPVYKQPPIYEAVDSDRSSVGNAKSPSLSFESGTNRKSSQGSGRRSEIPSFGSGHSGMSNELNYHLASNMGHILIKCIAELVDVRPADPIEYIARWLYRYADTRLYIAETRQWHQGLRNALTLLQNEKRDRLERFGTLYSKFGELYNGVVSHSNSFIAKKSVDPDLLRHLKELKDHYSDRLNIVMKEKLKKGHTHWMKESVASNTSIWSTYSTDSELHENIPVYRPSEALCFLSRPRGHARYKQVCKLLEGDDEKKERLIGYLGSDSDFGQVSGAKSTASSDYSGVTVPFIYTTSDDQLIQGQNLKLQAIQSQNLKLQAIQGQNTMGQSISWKNTQLDIPRPGLSPSRPFSSSENTDRRFSCSDDGRKRRMSKYSGTQVKQVNIKYCHWILEKPPGRIVCLHPDLGRLAANKLPSSNETPPVDVSDNDAGCMSGYEHEIYLCLPMHMLYFTPLHLETEMDEEEDQKQDKSAANSCN